MTVFFALDSNWLTDVPVPIELFSKPAGNSRKRSNKPFNYINYNKAQ